MKIEYGFMQFAEGTRTVTSRQYQYWLILSGDGQISSDDHPIVLTNHDVLEVPADLSFQLRCQAPFHIGLITVTDFTPGNKILQKKNHTDTELIRRVFFFAVEFRGYRHNAMEYLQYHLDKLMYETLATTGLEEYRINPQIAKALNVMNRHCFEPDYDIEEVIRASGYSRSHFHKLFRETTGFAPVGYIHEKRIERAKYLLRQPQKISIGETAALCGYKDVYYFSRMFRKLTGTSPSEYSAQP